MAVYVSDLSTTISICRFLDNKKSGCLTAAFSMIVSSIPIEKGEESERYKHPSARKKMTISYQQYYPQLNAFIHRNQQTYTHYPQDTPDLSTKKLYTIRFFCGRYIHRDIHIVHNLVDKYYQQEVILKLLTKYIPVYKKD